MLTIMVFTFGMNIPFAVEMYKSEQLYGDDMPAKIAKYYPDGEPADLYVVCLPTDIIGTSLIPPLRGEDVIKKQAPPNE